MKRHGWILLFMLLGFPACGGDQKSSDDRTKDAQKAIQEGMAKEKKMYEGMVKGVEDVQKKVEEKSK
jgi:hypothetical protein